MRWLALMALTACTSKEPEEVVDQDLDQDGDGLNSEFEALIGTSDETPDSDGDGCDDAVEVLTWYSPTDPDDHPHARAYPRGPLPSEAERAALVDEYGEDWEVGAMNPEWSLTDQHGMPVRIQDFFGQVVLIDIASEWCGPCREAAPILQEIYEEEQEQGFTAIQLLLEGINNNAEPDGQRWVNAFDLTYPVAVDYSPGDRYVTEVAQYYITSPTASYSIPNFSVIDRQGRIRELYRVGEDPAPEAIEAEVRGLIDPLLEEPSPELAPMLPENADELREELGLEDAWVVGEDVCG